MLRNAFDLLGTETTLRKILAAVSFSRTNTDAMRVNVENAASVTSAVNMANSTNTIVGGAVQVSPFANNSWNIMDAREPMRDQSLMAFQQTRNRWTIT